MAHLIDEDNSRGVLLGLLKGLSQVAFTLTSHLGHNFRAVDEEEECTSFVGDSSGHEGFTSTRGAVHKHTSRWFDTNRFEELRVPEREFDHFSDLGHLLAASTNVIVPNVRQVGLFIFTLDGFPFGVNGRILSNNAVLGGICFDDFELDTSASATGEEGVAFADRSVGLEEIRLEEDFENVAGETLDGIVKGQDVYTLAIFDVVASVNVGNISQFHSKVVSGDCGQTLRKYIGWDTGKEGASLPRFIWILPVHLSEPNLQHKATETLWAYLLPHHRQREQ